MAAAGLTARFSRLLRCARPSASAPAPPTLVCSRPRPCGSARARSRRQRGGCTESPAGEGFMLPAQSVPGQVGEARGAREGDGPGQRTGARRDRRRVPGREGSAVAPAADVDEVERGTASFGGAAGVLRQSCSVPRRSHWPQTPAASQTRAACFFLWQAQRPGMRVGEEVGGRGGEGSTPYLGRMKDGFLCSSYPCPAPFSLRLFAVSCSLN